MRAGPTGSSRCHALLERGEQRRPSPGMPAPEQSHRLFDIQEKKKAPPRIIFPQRGRNAETISAN